MNDKRYCDGCGGIVFGDDECDSGECETARKNADAYRKGFDVAREMAARVCETNAEGCSMITERILLNQATDIRALRPEAESKEKE